MKLKYKLLSILIISLVCYLVLRFLLLTFLIHPEFEKLKLESGLKDLDRVKNFINTTSNNLALTAKDWSVWDDTYKFMQNKNEHYIEDYLNKDVFGTIRINFFLIFDKNKHLYWGNTDGIKIDKLNHDTNFISNILAAEHIQSILSNYLFTESSQSLEASRGIAVTPYGIAIIAISPILDTKSIKPCAGSIVIGRFITEARIKDLSDLVEVPLNLYYPNGDGSDKFTEASTHLSDKTPVYHKYTSGNNLLLYTYLNTLKGSSPIILEVQSSLETVRKAEDIMFYSAMSGAFVFIILVLLLVTSVNHLITYPISKLTYSILKVSDSHDLSALTNSTRNDEIGILSRECHKLVSKYEYLLKKKEYKYDKTNEQTYPNPKQLKGIISVCEYCKKISDDNASWIDGGIYIKSNPSLKLNKSICPECIEDLNKGKIS